MPDYGVDATGRPTGQGQPSTGQETACPEGQTKDANGNCANNKNASGRGVSAEQYYNDYKSNFGFNAKQSVHGSLDPLINAMKTEGYNVTAAAPASGGYEKGIMLDGKFVKLLDGTDQSIWMPGGDAPSSGGSVGGSVTSFLSQPTVPTTPPPAGYKVQPYGGSTALPTYNAAKFAQSPDFNSTLQAPTEGLIQKMLSSEGSLNPAVVAQMKEGQKSTALSMADQLKQQNNTSAATRGVSGGGANLAANQQVDANTVGDISRGYRETDIAAAQANQADKMNAIGASTGFQNQLLQQYLGQNAQNMNVQQANAAEQGKQFTSEQAKAADEYARYLSREQLNLTSNDQAFQQWLASQGLTLNYQNAAMLADQFSKTYGLGVAKFLAGGN